MDRGAWWATVHRLQRIEHDLATNHTHVLFLNCSLNIYASPVSTSTVDTLK